ncbi:MAG: adenylyl-sulfate kinase [Pseudomonadota bacterium]|nr:adenylyl-sulfate kinase [Pseudomonadota bacterium]
MVNKIYWFTGLPCSGKTTLSTKLFEKLKEKDVKIIILDGDILRKGLNSDLNFSEQDRTENIRRVIELCKILFSQEYSVIVSLITPLNMQRKTIKKELKDSVKFIYLECDIEDCIKRDVKGMYKKAIEGSIKNFTGVDDPFETPDLVDLKINTSKKGISECVDILTDYFS